MVSVYVDGATAGTRHVGIAAIARTAEGDFLGWASRRMPRMTNNEAEYHAALLGVELAHMLEIATVEIVSDSEVVVRQMRGMSRVNSQRLKALHSRLCAAVAGLGEVSFRHVERDLNRVADALATEALHGRCVSMKGVAAGGRGSVDGQRGQGGWLSRWRRT